MLRTKRAAPLTLVVMRLGNEMICFEIYRNGNLICRAGDKNIYNLHTQLHYVKEVNWLKLKTSGMVVESEELDNMAKWHETESIDPGDEITIKVVDSDEPDAYEAIKHYGTLKLDNENKYFCSFCGREASTELGMYIGFSKANICHECLSKASEAVNKNNNA